jgi:hypothetical protein
MHSKESKNYKFLKKIMTILWKTTWANGKPAKSVLYLERSLDIVF